MTKSSHVIYIGIIIGLITYSALQTRNAADQAGEDKVSEHPVYTVSENAASGSPIELSNTSDASLLSELNALIAENALLQEKLSAALAQLHSEDSTPRATRSPNKQADQEAADLIARIAREKNLEFIDVSNLEERLQEEPVDYDWALDVDMKFRDFLLTSNALSDVLLETINCRTQICSINMSTTQLSQPVNMMLFHQELSGAGIFSRDDYMYVTLHNVGTGEFTLVLEKKPTSY